MFEKFFGKKEDGDNANQEERKPRDEHRPARPSFGNSSPDVPATSSGHEIVRNRHKTSNSRNLVTREPESREVTNISEKGKTVINRHMDNSDSITPDELKEIQNFTGEVYTAKSGSLPVTDAQRVYSCFLSNGMLLIDKAAPTNALVMEVKQAIRRANRKIGKEILVDRSLIRKVHEGADERNGKFFSRTSRGMGEQVQEMQHELLKLVREASGKRASDIHVFLNKKNAVIKIRAGGIMQHLREEHTQWAEKLCVAAFNMSDVSQSSYKPNDYQDARISSTKTPLPEGVDALRLHYNPLANGGRHMVARLLYKTSAEELEKDIDTLGYADIHVKLIRKMRKFPVGINIISGPTGSGKSTTLQKCLIALMAERHHQINVLTIEDPPEYDIPGSAQIPVMKGGDDDKAKASAFTQAISAAMRSDPDVIMIGEIRTAASAGLAFAAAMTGHQVWGSLHANDALSCLDRLGDMDVDLYKLTDPTLVTGLIAQRLVRRVCPHCSFHYDEALKNGLIDQYMEKNIIDIAGEKYLKYVRFANPDGCDKCSKTGSIGREVVAECINPSEKIMEFMRKRDKAAAHKQWLENEKGMTILEHAIQKMVLGYCAPTDVEDRMGSLDLFNIKRLETIMSPEFCNIEPIPVKEG